jgi:hypothetical protein
MENVTQHTDNSAFHYDDKEALLKITNEHPYFSLPWFYLLHDAENRNDGSLQKYRGMASLFFGNPGWLRWQLSLIGNNGEEVADEIIAEREENIAKDFDNIPAIEQTNDVVFTKENYENVQPPVTEDVNESPSIDLNENNTLTLKTGDELNTTKNELLENGPIEFEPLHTVDYFASQGIKVPDEPQPGDKLGNQLKSFTEWIKSMKKIHAQKIEMDDPQTDKKIQGIAESSNVESEVITEAMADVLIKQDKIEKAIELYEKLSLNNPSKSAYFAAKIERLKSA